MKYLLSCLLTLVSCFLQAQDLRGKVAVTIQTSNNTPAEGATAELRRTRDSALVKTAVTDKNGLAAFEPVKPGSYFIKFTLVGFAPAISPEVQVTETNLNVVAPTVTMLPAKDNQLQNVTVTGKKPFIQKLSDRIVVNVESSIVSAGSTALEVLERSPGVVVDQNDAISLMGKAGVIIMIDGKPTPMTGADLANYLRGLPSNAIERIDIITNPSARYDAAGNAGIIDIRMKKDQRLGANGTFNAGIGQGVYPKANAGTTFNYRNKKVNIFGNYNFAYRENLNHLIINRNFFDNGVFKGSDNKDNYAHMPLRSNNVRAGVDFFPSKNTILGVVVNSNFTGITRRADIGTLVNDINYQPDFRFVSKAGQHRPRTDSRPGLWHIQFELPYPHGQQFL